MLMPARSIASSPLKSTIEITETHGATLCGRCIVPAVHALNPPPRIVNRTALADVYLGKREACRACGGRPWETRKGRRLR